jgi:predicted transcriptional regulator
MWHHDPVEPERPELTELDEAIADIRPDANERRLLRVAAALYVANRVHGLTQAKLIERYGLNRETIRRHVEDERIRRGEINPTPRYLREQARKTEPKKRSTRNG